MDRRALETSRLSPGERAKVVIQKLLHVQHLHNLSVPATTCNCLPNAKGLIPITRQLLILLAVPSVTESLDVHHSSDFTSM